MANTIESGDFYIARFVCSIEGQISVNTLHYVCVSKAGDGGTDNSLAAALDALFAQLFKNVMSNSATYRGVSCQRISPTPKTVPAISTTGAGLGVDESELLPAQTCGIITKRTDFAGRRFRGRVYVPFPAESSNVENLPTADYKSNLAALGAVMLDDVAAGSDPNTSTMSPVLFHRATTTATPITSIVAKRLWGTQRRRGNYGQLNPIPF